MTSDLSEEEGERKKQRKTGEKPAMHVESQSGDLSVKQDHDDGQTQVLS